ncbi:MAG TPA: hypothetical protein VKY56_09010 [Chloroflexota bacterium]|nr:hypothetical protein [Chloroflexota bacterium]
MNGHGGEPLAPRDRSSLRRSAEELFGSASLLDLLILFCQEPSRPFYVNELVRLTGRFPRSVQLALARLAAAGIVASERRANAKFYFLVEDHPFVPALRTLVAAIPDVTGALQSSLGAVSGVRVAFLRPKEKDEDAWEEALVVIGGERTDVERAVAEAAERLGMPIRLEHFGSDEWERQARRERSYVRWLLAEERRYLIGSDDDLPGRLR